MERISLMIGREKMAEIEAPNSKHQITNESQCSNSKFQTNFLVIRDWSLKFIKVAPENPVLWTGMKGASARGRKKQARC
jgi:hypothetical protein